MSRPLVVHIITRLDLGGAQQNTLDTCRLLDRSRFRVALMSGPGGYLDSEAARIADLDFRLVADLVRPVAPGRDLRAMRALKGHLADMRRDGDAPVIVHTHSSKAGVLGRLAARAAGIRTVVHTIHGYGHPAFQSLLLRNAAVRVERYLAPRTTRFIAVSRDNVVQGRDLGLFRTTPVELVRSGFDVARFRDCQAPRHIVREELGIPREAFVVGSIACLKPQKDPLTFVRAAAALKRNVPEAHFAIAGDGELRPRVEALADRLGIRRDIRLLGWRDDVERVLRALDVFWLTSRWEGLPRALVQAMAARVPVVACAVDGVKDVLEDGVTGFAIEPGDADRFASRTIELQRDPDLRERLCAAAAGIPDEFAVERMVRRLEDVYCDALAQETGS